MVFNVSLFVAVSMLLSLNVFVPHNVFIQLLNSWINCIWVNLTFAILCRVALFSPAPISPVSFIFFFLLTLLLPIEFEVNVACDSSDWQVLLSQFHNFLKHILVWDTLQLRVHLEVFGYHFLCNFSERLDLVAWECLSFLLFCLKDLLSDISVLQSELLLFLLLLGSLAGRCLRSWDFLSQHFI